MRHGQPLVFGVPASCLVFCCFWLAAPAPRVDRASFGRIALGMERKAVEDLIGAPPGNHMRRPGTVHGGTLDFAAIPGASFKLAVWEGDHFAISVGFDATGRVQAKFLEAVIPVEPSPDQSDQLAEADI